MVILAAPASAVNRPRVWAKIHVRHRVQVLALDPKAVLDAIRLAEPKYCSVMAMLQRSAEITFDYLIEEAP